YAESGLDISGFLELAAGIGSGDDAETPGSLSSLFDGLMEAIEAFIAERDKGTPAPAVIEKAGSAVAALIDLVSALAGGTAGTVEGAETPSPRTAPIAPDLLDRIASLAELLRSATSPAASAVDPDAAPGLDDLDTRL